MYDVVILVAGSGLVCGIFLGVLLRCMFGRREIEGAMPVVDGDLGLLETVAVVPTRAIAEVLVVRLADERVRATLSQRADGWQLLAFPEDADDARRALRAL